MKGISFFFHYAKDSDEEPRIALNYGGKTHVVIALYCNVATHSVINKKNNPKFAMAGIAAKITFSEDKSTAYIW